MDVWCLMHVRRSCGLFDNVFWGGDVSAFLLVSRAVALLSNLLGCMTVIYGTLDLSHCLNLAYGPGSTLSLASRVFEWHSSVPSGKMSARFGSI